MKHKKLFRSVTALLAALVLMGGFSVTAFAGGGDVSDEPPTPVTETEPEETTGGYEPQPLTPEGNICFCVASVNDKNIPVYRHFTEVCPILLYGKLLHLLVDQPLFFFRNVKLHLYISLSVFHFRTAFRYKGLGLSQQAFSANGYSFAVLAIYSIPPPKGGICCAFL